MSRQLAVRIKRAYDDPADDDGYRVLVDRVWPRGVRKVDARIDEWARDVAPSAALRRWFGHDPERFAEFSTRYRAELADSPALGELRGRCAGRDVVTLVYGAKDTTHNQAVVLAGLLNR